ncbi:phage tail family protein, partial [Streptococcus constellatus]|uniref:phage tail family protein n=1 Tax=Streptococcus constellatus TaxID=76860 RepID=UPI00118284B4
QGVLEAEIINNGSAEISVNYRIKLKHESGYVGIVSQYGAMQFGKIEETDLVEEKKNVLLAANGKGDFKNWTDGTIFYENQNKKVVTKMSADSSFGGRLGLLPANFTNTANGAYFGAVKELKLSEQAKDWYIWARAWFETGLVSQTGAWCLSVVDSDNHLIAGMAIEKSERARNRALVLFLMGDGAGGSRVVKSIEFTPSVWVKDNPYSSEGRDQNRNMFDLRKQGDKFTYFWYGGYHHYFESRIKDKQAAKVQFFAGQYKGGNSTINQLVTHHYLNDFSFYKLNVPFWRDVPNRYPTGAELFIDATGEVSPEEKGRLYVNNLLAPDDEILGTDYFKVPPGKTKVQLLVSSFAEVESARAEIEEAWI